VTALTFEEARRTVIEKVRAAGAKPAAEIVGIEEAAGRVLAAPVRADRDYPPLDRSVRDGFALRAGDAPGELEIIGEVRAGDLFEGEVGPGEAVEIMTGAPLPRGADAVVMVEHVKVEGSRVVVPRAVERGENVNPRAAEAARGDVVLPPGGRLGYPEVGLLAAVGQERVEVYRRPVASIIATGDEIVELGREPESHQIRNSNSWSLAAQVARAGGEARILPVAMDTLEHTLELIGQGLEGDLLLLSGGVSAGKYDVVEQALERLGARFWFTRVLIQPGQPLVFGSVRDKFFFGLPGNPASTMVCFELFARAALELLGGQQETLLPLLETTLAADFRHRPGLTRFLPARLSEDGRALTPLRWAGSSDIAAVARANAFLVAEPDKPEYKAGERIRVMLK
jgi:molybdopterin molybdotransferase